MYQNFLNKISIIDNNFLNNVECKDIENKILSNKTLWQTPHEHYLIYFPYALYLTNRKFYSTTEYFDNVKRYKNIMYDLFGSYYEKIRKKLEEEFQVEIQFEPTLNYPGFHIVNKRININFHKDVFFEFQKIHDLESQNCKILSVILPISLPESGAGLLIRHKTYESRTTLEYDDELNYVPGMLAVWDGDISHSLRPFDPVTESDYRITMQMHVGISLVESKGYLFW